MTEDPVGGRVLVVAPSESAPDSEDDLFVRGGDASRIDSGGDGSVADGGGETPEFDSGAGAVDDGENSASDVDGDDRTTDSPDEQPTDPSRDGSDRDCDPETVAAGIADRLPVDVVVRNEQTAREYLEELGPTIDCVIVLGTDTGPLGNPLDDVSVPAVVVEGPVVETGVDPDTEVITVAEVADRVQSTVRAARSRSDLQEQNTRLTALSRYARDITGCETVDAVLDRTLKAATDALAFDHCVVMLVEGDQLVPQTSVLPDPELRPRGVTEGISGRTLQTGEAEIVPDMQTDPDAIPEHDDFHAVLSVPIGSRGVFQAASRSHDAFDERDKEFAEILAGYTREALARLEREVTLRAERDRLHAFYTSVPVPVLCVERRNGKAIVAEVNEAYEAAFGGSPAGQPLSTAVPDVERDRYEAALNGEESHWETIVRRVGDREIDVEFSVVPISPPGVPEHAFGVYLTEEVDSDG